MNDEFLTLLDPDPERAWGKYVALVTRLVKFFEWRQCSSPEDLAQDTMLRVFQKARSGEVRFTTSDITPYFFAVAKFVVLEDRREVAREAAVPLDEALSLGAVDFGQMETRICLNQCLACLPTVERLLLERYFNGERATLRAEFGLSEEALRVKVHRIKERVKRLIRGVGTAGGPEMVSRIVPLT
jgi:DNA-directed RNA polymerase specialized sigma24 family protein